MSKRTLARRARERRRTESPPTASPSPQPAESVTPAIPDVLCEPVFVIDGQPNGTHLSRALEMNVPVVVLRTDARTVEERTRDFVGLMWLPEHPSIQADYVGDPSNIPYFRTLWCDFVRGVKTRLAREGDEKQPGPSGIPDWDRKSGCLWGGVLDKSMRAFPLRLRALALDGGLPGLLLPCLPIPP